ncbi:protein of unknown function [Taphrina deformans PYCC 5710]|uniref:Uncharacterized protein n=1 Tax=Taphrina deformans (strain PYCC 5710 / ATCC 11124 / CBS 356.35 / IMI 108563 / JCM 9778 / NBRC 8474) TaxID=1097556 RepID=S0BE35_TAPDE|nr:protein of unknown function [Taphrina deformans PYCC 5710]|eukprot:CCG81314.1 protein of unknown function [Taphrina deformans PYCC 5710]
MSNLHVHGQVTPTSKVIRNPRTLKSPLKSAPKVPTTTRTRRPTTSRKTDFESQITGHQLSVEADFRGLDVLSAIDYLKRLQTDMPPRLSREKSVALLNRRRQMPTIVLAHQITSLFPNMPDLEKEIHFLVREGRLIQLPLQSGEPAYIRREDYKCPPVLLDTPVDDLSDSQFREFSHEGYLVRRNGTVVLSAPNIGTFLSGLRAARSFVLGYLAKSIALEKDIKARYELWKDGGLFQFENLMHDLVGSSRVEVLMLTVGRALRITRRGREDR